MRFLFKVFLVLFGLIELITLIFAGWQAALGIAIIFLLCALVS